MKKQVHFFTLSLLLGLLSLLPVEPLFAQTWTLQGADINGEAAGDNSGVSVAYSADGTTVAIGATRNDNIGADAGHVRVYKLVSGTWTQQGADIDGEAAADRSGYAVSLSSDGLTVAIGAPRNDGNGADAGHVRVYKLVSGTWTKQGADIDGEAANDQSGSAVSLSSDGLTVAIGAPTNRGGGTTFGNRGHVQVYKLVSGTWTKQGADIDGLIDDDQSGNAVSLSSDGLTVAIGASNANGGGSYRGRVRVYKLVSGTWTQQGADINGEADDDYSGYAIALSSDGLTVATGASNNAGNGGSYRGHVRVHKLVSGTWTQQGTDIDGEADLDFSGFSVSLSSDGLTVAIGAPFYSGGAAKGRVRVYKLISATWTKQGGNMDGAADGDQSGSAVSLSADGTKVAIGAPTNGGTGALAGHARVYYLEISLPVELLDFKATPQYNGNLLTWTTASEVNNKGFQVERRQATDDSWDILGFKTANHKASTYNFTDDTPCRDKACLVSTTNYYRLRQMDNDGKETLSKVVSVSRNSSTKLKVYPNPVSNVLTVEFGSSLWGLGASDFQIYNFLGRQVLSGKKPPLVVGGLDVSALPQGTYVLKMGSEQAKFVKQ